MLFFHAHSAQYEGCHTGKGVEFMRFVDVHGVAVLDTDAAAINDIDKAFGIDSGFGYDSLICLFDNRFVYSF